MVLGKETKDLVTEEQGLDHILKRQTVLGGVVLSGGEPCIQEGLPELIAKIKGLKFRVKLDTNGMFPSMLEELFRRPDTRPDYIALVLKIAPSRYGELTGSDPAGKRLGQLPSLGDFLIQSAALIRESGIQHEYRTLALPGGFITEEDIEALAPLTDSAPWHFRIFRGENCLDPAWEQPGDSDNEARLNELAVILAGKAAKMGKNAHAAERK